MDSTTTAAKVAKLVAKHLSIGVEQLVPGATLHALGADSLDVVKISMALEDEFGVIIEDDEMDLEGAGTVEDLVRIVAEKG